MEYLGNVYHRALHELGVSEWVTMGAAENEAEFRQNFRKVVGVDDSGSSILSDDEADWGFTWDELAAKVSELSAGEDIFLLRMERDRLIAETDWWVLPDRTPTQAQLDYRQALRDITNTYSSLDDVVWPTKP
jgi:hypothetical protein